VRALASGILKIRVASACPEERGQKAAHSRRASHWLVFRSNHMIHQRGAVGWVEQRETHRNGHRRWVSLKFNPSYGDTTR
jgi:hypothetical protein